ncbi:MAG: wax ester/triacylglycerol synthase family O-acyltransferase [Pseudomonadota bacterium]
MQQLSGMDASFLYLETINTPMHIGSLCIYDQSTAPGGSVRFKEILAFYEERLHRARVFRQRLARVPMSLDHPYWIEDPDFDLEFHVRHVALPAPGDWRQLCIQAARLHARALDMNRPLWEVYVIEGLDAVEGVPKGSFAVVSKIHHAAIDGVSGAEIAAALHDLSPMAEVSPPARDWVAEREPSGIEMLARTTARTVTAPARLLKLARKTLPGVGRLAAGLAKKELQGPPPVPRTRFNNNVTSHRVFDARAFSLDDIRAIKNTQPGVTVNDVVVSICGGALRKYLESKYELPEESLVAMAPMSIRREGEQRSGGNQVATMSLPVRSDIADPLERMLAVHEASQEAKKMTFTAGTGLAVAAAELLPSTTAGMLVKAYSRMRIAESLPPMFNTVITNVPGVNVPLYSMGSKMVANFGLGPVVHGVGLFQPVLSYNNRITISAISCREMMPDPAFYCDCLQAAFDELKAATIDKPAAATKSGAKSPKKTARKKVAKKKPASKKKLGKRKSAATKKNAAVATPVDTAADAAASNNVTQINSKQEAATK